MKAVVVTGKFVGITLLVFSPCNWSVNVCIWKYLTGAKGKFSGGFDITAFGGLQGGKGMDYIITNFFLALLSSFFSLMLSL